MAENFTHLLLDLGGVVLPLPVSSPTATQRLGSRTIQTILSSSIWHNYERDLIGQEDCYQLIASTFKIDPEVWRETEEAMTRAVRSDLEVIAAIKAIMTSYPHLKLCAFTNMPKLSYETLLPELQSLDEHFTAIIPSWLLGQRKPDAGAFNKALESVGALPEHCILVDDTIENVMAARVMGMQGIHYKNVLQLSTDLQNILGDPAARALQYLKRNAKNLWCTLSDGRTVKDNFSQLWILSCTGDRDLVHLENEGVRWQFFIGTPLLTDVNYPKDTDTTSLAYIVLESYSQDKDMDIAMDCIEETVNADGLTQVYFDPNRPRFCAFTSANVLRFFYRRNRGHKMKKTVEYFCRLLDSRAYELGSRYYYHPDWILLILADVCSRTDCTNLIELRAKVKTQLQRRIGSDSDSFAAAIRLLATQALSMDNDQDLQTLLATQQLDGAWKPAHLYRYGHVDVTFKSRAVVTAMAYKAISVARATKT